MRQTARNFK